MATVITDRFSREIKAEATSSGEVMVKISTGNGLESQSVLLKEDDAVVLVTVLQEAIKTARKQ